MRRLVKNIVQRLLGAGGYVVISPSAYSALQNTLAETKGGVSQIQGQLGDTLSHVLALRTELTNARERLAETKGGVSQIQGQLGETLSHVIVLRGEIADARERLAETRSGVSQLQSQLGDTLSQVIALRNQAGDSGGNPRYADLRDLPRQLDVAATGYLTTDLTELPGESPALAAHYARLANLVSRYWIADSQSPTDLYPDDDMTLEYSIAAVDYRAADEAPVDEELPSLPWRQLWSDPECGVLLLLGESNAANHGETRYTPQRPVFSLDFRRMQCFRAADPLAGASGAGGSIWSRLGDMLIENGVFRRVLFVPLAFGDSSIRDWVPEGPMHRRTALALSRLRKELDVSVLPFSAVLWQQGEAEANHTQMSAQAYRMHFHDLVADLRANGVFAPVFAASATFCKAGPHSFQNRTAVRKALLELPDPTGGIFAGPDTDAIGPEGRFDGCHFSENGLRRCAELWLGTLGARQNLLEKLITTRASGGCGWS
jgi:hypothetical protein